MKKFSGVGPFLVGAALMSASTLSWSGLYVYPVKSTNIVANEYSMDSPPSRHTSHNADYYRAVDPQGNHEYYRSTGILEGEQADSTVNRSVAPNTNIPCYGRQVPIEIAVSSIFKDFENFNVSPLVSGERISWSLGQDNCREASDIVDSINAQGNLFISIGGDGNTVGVGASEREAIHYSYVNPKVWSSDSTKSIKENLTLWAESDGWSVVWPEVMNEIDFEAADTILYGELAGENGVFHRVLKQISTIHPGTNLSVEFWGNNYIVVKEGGYTTNQEGFE